MAKASPEGGHRDALLAAAMADTVQDWATLQALLIPLASWPGTPPPPELPQVPLWTRPWEGQQGT